MNENKLQGLWELDRIANYEAFHEALGQDSGFLSLLEVYAYPFALERSQLYRIEQCGAEIALSVNYLRTWLVAQAEIEEYKDSAIRQSTEMSGRKMSQRHSQIDSRFSAVGSSNVETFGDIKEKKNSFIAPDYDSFQQEDVRLTEEGKFEPKRESYDSPLKRALPRGEEVNQDGDLRASVLKPKFKLHSRSSKKLKAG